MTMRSRNKDVHLLLHANIAKVGIERSYMEVKWKNMFWTGAYFCLFIFFRRRLLEVEPGECDFDRQHVPRCYKSGADYYGVEFGEGDGVSKYVRKRRLRKPGYIQVGPYVDYRGNYIFLYFFLTSTYFRRVSGQPVSWSMQLGKI